MSKNVVGLQDNNVLGTDYIYDLNVGASQTKINSKSMCFTPCIWTSTNQTKCIVQIDASSHDKGCLTIIGNANSKSVLTTIAVNFGGTCTIANLGATQLTASYSNGFVTISGLVAYGIYMIFSSHEILGVQVTS